MSRRNADRARRWLAASSLAVAVAVCAACVSTASTGRVAAASPQAGSPTAPGSGSTGGIGGRGGRFEPPATAQAIRHAQVRMRDGVRLDTDVYLPSPGPTRVPVVLVRTPYRDELTARAPFFQTLLQAGYAVVQQHERGRYLSEGQVAMLSHAAEDGVDTFDWIVAQPWSNGRIATIGCSSSAENQLKLAAQNHPAHKAMIAYSAGVGVGEAGPFREQGNFWRGGVWQQGWFNYFMSDTQKDWPQLPAGLSDEARQRAAGAFTVDNHGDQRIGAPAYDRVRMHLPMIDMAQAIPSPRTDFEEYLSRGPAGSPLWHRDRVTAADHIHVPGLWAEAVYDISARSTTALFERVRSENPAGQQALVLTNGQHCGFGRETAAQVIGERALGDARFDYAEREIAWLDHWLKDDASAPLPPQPYMVYMAGENRWRAFDALPAATRSFYLDSDGRANTLDGDGRLLDAPPAGAAVDRFTYDPANPVIAHGGEISGVGTDQRDTDGAFDQRPIERRPDVLVYTSAPLAADLPVFGFVTAELLVGSDAPDTDITVRLIDVEPDGRAWNIADTIQRLRYRNGEDRPAFLAAGEHYRIAPPPMLVANVFGKGHRLRVEVSSSLFPNYARNLNTDGDPYRSTATRVATNRVLHGAGTPSRIVLPIALLSALPVGRPAAPPTAPGL